MKKKTESLFEKKLILQILSVVAAIVLWFAITYTEDPSISVVISNVTLETYGEDSLIANGLVLAGRNELPDISVEVRGNRSAVRSVLNSVTAYVDLEEITEPGEYICELTFDVPNPSVMITSKRTSTINVNIEKAVSKDIPVYIRQTGADSNSSYLIKSTPEVQTVNISGTQDDVSRIKEALISIDVGEMTEDNSGEYEVSYADASHNILTLHDSVYTEHETISADNEIYLRKSVDVALDPSADLSGYQVIVRSFSQETVEIGVKEEDYDSVTTVYAAFVNGISENANGEYRMRLVIPDDIYCPSENEEIIMNADIEQITTETRSIEVSPENVPDGMSVTLNPASVTVELTGAKSRMQEVEAKVNLSGLSAGTYELPVVFVTDNTGVTVDTPATVSVTIE